MISGHIQAISALQDAIDELRSTIETMPDSIDKYKLEAHLEIMEHEAERYAENSLILYDKLFDFLGCMYG